MTPSAHRRAHPEWHRELIELAALLLLVVGAVDEVLHVPARVRHADLVAAVETAGGYDVTASRADVRELDDVPTRAAALANDPEWSWTRDLVPPARTR